jgi:hypothetical protein
MRYRELQNIFRLQTRIDTTTDLQSLCSTLVDWLISDEAQQHPWSKTFVAGAGGDDWRGRPITDVSGRVVMYTTDPAPIGDAVKDWLSRLLQWAMELPGVSEPPPFGTDVTRRVSNRTDAIYRVKELCQWVTQMQDTMTLSGNQDSATVDTKSVQDFLVLRDLEKKLQQPKKRGRKSDPEGDAKIADEYWDGLEEGKWTGLSDYLKQRHKTRYDENRKAARSWLRMLLGRVEKRKKIKPKGR